MNFFYFIKAECGILINLRCCFGLQINLRSHGFNYFRNRGEFDGLKLAFSHLISSFQHAISHIFFLVPSHLPLTSPPFILQTTLPALLEENEQLLHPILPSSSFRISYSFAPISSWSSRFSSAKEEPHPAPRPSALCLAEDQQLTVIFVPQAVGNHRLPWWSSPTACRFGLIASSTCSVVFLVGLLPLPVYGELRAKWTWTDHHLSALPFLLGHLVDSLHPWSNQLLRHLSSQSEARCIDPPSLSILGSVLVFIGKTFNCNHCLFLSFDRLFELLSLDTNSSSSPCSAHQHSPLLHLLILISAWKCWECCRASLELLSLPQASVNFIG